MFCTLVLNYVSPEFICFWSKSVNGMWLFLLTRSALSGLTIECFPVNESKIIGLTYGNLIESRYINRQTVTKEDSSVNNWDVQFSLDAKDNKLELHLTQQAWKPYAITDRPTSPGLNHRETLRSRLFGGAMLGKYNSALTHVKLIVVLESTARDNYLISLRNILCCITKK